MSQLRALCIRLQIDRWDPHSGRFIRSDRVVAVFGETSGANPATRVWILMIASPATTRRGCCSAATNAEASSRRQASAGALHRGVHSVNGGTQTGIVGKVPASVRPVPWKAV